MRETHAHRLAIAALSLAAAGCSPRDTAAPAQRIRMRPLEAPLAPMAAEPFVSALPGDGLALSWLQREADSTTVTLHVAVRDSSGAWSETRDIVHATNLFVNWADFPSVVALADGRLLAHWLQKNGTGKYSYDIRLAASADLGKTWTDAVLPHEAGVAAEHGFVTLLPRADSSADIVFLNGSPAPARPATGASGAAEGHGPPMRLAQAQWRGAGAVAAPTILDERTCDCCQTAAALTDRGPVVLYRDRSEAEQRDISVIRQVDGRWTAPVPLHADGWIIDACPVNGPAIAAQGSRVAAAWFTGAKDTARVQVAFSADAGATFGPPVRIDGGSPAGRVDIELLESGDAVVTWIERTGAGAAEVRARLVSPAQGAEPPLTIAALGPGRGSGFPRMARRRRDIILAWTAPGDTSRIRLAELTVAPR